MVFLALIPVLVPVVMIAARRPSLQAAACGVIAAVVLSLWRFPTSGDRWAAAGTEWAPVLVEVLVIIGGGLALSEANRASGRQARLASWLEGVLGTGVSAALAVVHGVTPFAESVTGFGIGVTVAIPLLLHLGFDSRRAATIGLLGLCAVPWGSMGPGTLIAATLSGTGFHELGVASAVASGPVFLVVGLVAGWMSSAPGSRVPALAGAAISACVLWVSVGAANLVLGTAPAGAVGALITLAVHVAFHRVRGGRLGPVRSLAEPLAGYAVLLGGVLVATLLVTLTGSGSSGWRYLASPAVWLFLAVAVTTPRSLLRAVASTTARKWMVAGPVTGLFVVLGVTMAVSGMSATLAHGVASIGSGYASALPFVAALGGYLTGSNSAANAMFAAPQAQIITALGLAHLPAMAIHNVASSLLLMASPAKVELAAQLCPEPDRARPAGIRVLVTDLAITAILAAALLVIAHH